MTIRCIPLREAPEAASTLARWFKQEWHGYFASHTLEQVAEYFPILPAGALPSIVVAFEADTVMGTAALRLSSIRPGEPTSPWLGGLYVDAAARRRGVARALIHAIEGQARQLGVPALRSGTLSAHALFEALGWRNIGEGVQGEDTVTVYEKTLRRGLGA
jgi:GNAT superfamily N-acetyltransferase